MRRIASTKAKKDFQTPPVVFQPRAADGMQAGFDQLVELIRPTLGPLPHVVACEKVAARNKIPELLDSGGTVARRVIQIADRQEDVGLMFLRHALWQQQERVDKPMMFTETGFPSAVGYHIEDQTLVIPETDNDLYAAPMADLMTHVQSVNADFDGRIQALYFYEWRDNLYHSKIWNIEQSPIHVAFGLCDRFEVPKFDIRKLLTESNS